MRGLWCGEVLYCDEMLRVCCVVVLRCSGVVWYCDEMFRVCCVVVLRCSGVVW